jgi:D-lactate dehydrogenase
MKILYSYRTEEEKNEMSQKLLGHDVVFHQGSLQEGEWSGEGVECLCVFVTSSVGKTEIEKCSNLKLIATRSTGFDHIDVAFTKEKGIAVATVPFYGENTVAEFAFALLLTISRNMRASIEKTKEGSFSSEGLEGFDLKGKTLGVIGTGSIGKNVIKIGKGFGMNVIAFDVKQDGAFASEIGFPYLSLEDLLSQSDVISLHLPENEHTRHMINKEKISLMKRGSYIINTARGGLIETEALVWGLKEGIVAGAGLDVLSEEGNVDDEMRLLGQAHPNENAMKTLLMNHYLLEHPMVVITPHTAFNTKEAMQRILDVTVENITLFASGNPKNLLP